MIRRQQRAGFTLIELMIVVAIIAIIASIAIPRLMSARLSANEAAAISTLRSVATAQAQLQSSDAVDTDSDGAGEYGYFGELSGAKPLRVTAAGLPGPGTVGVDELFPSILSSSFNNIAGGRVQRQGYLFQIWLPVATPGGGPVGGIPEDATGGKMVAPFPGSNNGEIMWCCYAWPSNVQRTGNRAFFVSYEGELLQCQNRSATPFDSTVTTPPFDEAFVTPLDMSSSVRIGVPGGTFGTVWTPVQI
jgi:prepilin-type N-terminal cleavage/methylation domain-containing protein